MILLQSCLTAPEGFNTPVRCVTGQKLSVVIKKKGPKKDQRTKEIGMHHCKPMEYWTTDKMT